MTDRLNYLIVALAADMRDDDAEGIIQAILMLRGVLRVEPHVADPEGWTAEARAKQALMNKLLEIVR